MAVSAGFIEFIKDAFAPLGEITVRKMFGGGGVYCDGLFFAVLAEETVYLKTDVVTRAAFEGAGLEPFTFEMKSGDMTVTSYYAAPEGMFDDEDDLRRWTTLALDAARRAAKLKPAPARKAAKKAARKTAKKTAKKKRAR